MKIRHRTVITRKWLRDWNVESVNNSSSSDSLKMVASEVDPSALTSKETLTCSLHPQNETFAKPLVVEVDGSTVDEIVDGHMFSVNECKSVNCKPTS